MVRIDPNVEAKVRAEVAWMSEYLRPYYEYDPLIKEYHVKFAPSFTCAIDNSEESLDAKYASVLMKLLANMEKEDIFMVWLILGGCKFNTQNIKEFCEGRMDKSTSIAAIIISALIEEFNPSDYLSQISAIGFKVEAVK